MAENISLAPWDMDWMMEKQPLLHAPDIAIDISNKHFNIIPKLIKAFQQSTTISFQSKNFR